MIRILTGLTVLLSATPALAQHTGHPMPPGMKMDMPKPKPKPPVPKPAPKPPAPAKKPAAKKPIVAPKPAPARPAARKPATNPARAQERPPVSDAPVEEPMDHGSMDHESMEGMTMEPSDAPMAGMTHGMNEEPMPSGDGGGNTMGPAETDHGGMDHSGMDMGAMTGEPVIPILPPPPSAGTGRARAADAIWGADAMRTSRAELAHHTGGQSYGWVMADRLEYQARGGRDGVLWDAQGYYGGDIDKFWFKTEGEASFGDRVDDAEVQALWSHAIGPWFDLQTGVRYDIRPVSRPYAVVGVQGLVPYLFEVDAAAFLSSKGDLTARIEGEYDQRITQRLILQPRAELNLAAQDVPEQRIGAGLSSVEAGLRLRYEIRREFAPYIGVSQQWSLGRSADFVRRIGEDASTTNIVAGVRLWF